MEKKGKIKTKFDDMPDPEEPLAVTYISTGSSAVDTEILSGGIPRTRLTQVYGPTDACKTVFGYRISAMAQRQFPEETVVWIDVEKTFNSDFATNNGVDVSKLRYHAASTAEEVANLLAQYAAKPGVSLIVVDSIGHANSNTNVGPKAFESGFKVTVAGDSKILTALAKNVTASIHREGGPAVFLINQVRVNIGVMHGDPETTPGGNNLKHALSLNLRLGKAKGIDTPTPGSGVEIRVRVKRSKLGRQGIATGDSNHLKVIFQPDGIENAQVYNIADEAFRAGIIEKKGSWIKSADPEVPISVQGQEKLVALIREDPKLRKLLEDKIASSLSMVGFGAVVTPEIEDELDRDQ